MIYAIHCLKKKKSLSKYRVKKLLNEKIKYYLRINGFNLSFQYDIYIICVTGKKVKKKNLKKKYI